VKALAGWVLLGAVAVAALGLYGREQRARGRAEAQLVTLKAANDSLAKLQRKVDTVYAGQKIVYAGIREQWDVARVAHLQGVLDSLRARGIPKPETVRVEVPVSVLVTADSTIRACEALVLTCDEKVSLWSQRYANLEAQIAAMPKPRAAWKVWGERVTLVVGTAAVCSAGRR